MISQRIVIGAFGLIVFLAAPALRADNPPPANVPINAKIESLPDGDSLLLSQARYQVRTDGTVLDPSTGKPVSREELPFLIQRLQSNQRLKALLQLNLILNQSRGEKHLTPAERESIRKIVSENWRLFSHQTRKDFRGYFSLQELEAMNRIPLPQAAMTEPELQDHSSSSPEKADIESRPAESASRIVPAQAPAAAQLMPAVLVPAPLQQSAAPPAEISRPAAEPPPLESLNARPEKPAAPQLGVMLPWSPGRTITLPKPETPTPIESSVSTAAASAQTSPDISSAPVARASAEPAALSESTAAAVSAPPPTPPAPAAPSPAARLEPPSRNVKPEEFENFLLAAPYGREAKSMLRLISAKAPDFARARVLNDVMSSLPQISVDSGRVNGRRHSRLIWEAGGPASVILNEGLILQERRGLFLGSATQLLPISSVEPDSPPIKQERGPWGQTAFYKNGSRRAVFTLETQAGYLLADLVRLDARLRGWDESAYAVETAARAAQWLFYGALRQDDFLDPETRLSYQQWLDQPAQYADHLILSLAASRSGTLDPLRKEPSAASKARAFLAEAAAAEKKFRQERQADAWKE